MNDSSPDLRTVATGAVACLAAFPAAVTALNLVQIHHYSPMRQAMSELALGRGGAVMNLAFCMLGVGSILLAVALRWSLRAVVAPVALIVTGGLDFVSAVFHATLTGTPDTTASRVHQTAGVVTFLLLMIAMFSTVPAMRRSAPWRPFATPTLVWAATAVATFFLVPILGDAHFGVAQRIFVATVLVWMITTGVRARRLASVRVPAVAALA